tara:strand:- start:6221 stop:6910 length:690 start_codon:yes stop_codon:yes gene_type:complete
MEKVGTNYGGWLIPKDIKLDSESIVYSGGVGEDISFDLLLSDKYDSNIVLIDPTERASKHYEEVKEYFKTKKWEFSGDIQKDYYVKVGELNVNFDKISYLNIGIWNKNEKLKFYKQNNPQYVSQSLIGNMFGRKYDEVEVDNIKNIMEKQGHDKIDLLKLDIEGAEIKVLNNMLDDKIYPRYLCIEFDLYLQKKDKNGETKTLLGRLIKIGYRVLKNDNYNVTLEYLKS